MRGTWRILHKFNRIWTILLAMTRTELQPEGFGLLIGHWGRAGKFSHWRATATDGDFSASSNATKISFKCGNSEAATEKAKIVGSTGSSTQRQIVFY